MRRAFAVFVSSLVAVLGAAQLRAQEGMAMPKPGPEHEMLKGDVGVWDATVEMATAPGAPASVSKGTETNTLVGGFWLVSRFKGDMMGQPFEGLGTTGFDPGKRKYVGTWIDSMTPGLYTSEGTYDAATKTMTTWMEGPDPSGKVTKTRATTQWQGKDARVFTMYGPKAADGKEPVTMKITYKRHM
jgi:hypothetical protein